MCLAGCADEGQYGIDPADQKLPSSPTDLPAISQAAYQILESILPHRVMDNFASPKSSANGTREPPIPSCSLTRGQEVEGLGGDEVESQGAENTVKKERFLYLVSTSKLALSDLHISDRSPRSGQAMYQTSVGGVSFPGVDENVASALHDELKRYRVPSTGREAASRLGNLAGLDQMYLITEEDISSILRTVITAVGEGHDSTQVPSEEMVKLPQRPSLPRPDLHRIQPTPAAVADPATSISLPKTSFAVAGPDDLQVQTRTTQLDKFSTTTIVSRQSISRITWAPDTIIDASNSKDEDPISPLEPVTSVATLTTVETQSGNAQEVLRDLISCNPFIIEHSESRLGGNKRCENSMFSNEEDAHITSFPELRSRHCTNEWLNPPPEIKKTVEITEDDLYIQGVDAHCGNPSRISVVVLEGDPPKPRHCNHDLFDENPFCKAIECSTDLPVTHSPRVSIAEKRLGASIGTSSHRRRSSQFVTQQPGLIVEDQDHLLPGFMDKIRRGGRKIFKHRARKSSDQRSGEFATPYNSPDDLQAQSAIRSRDSIVRERTIEPPQVDQAGIYEALTGSRLVVPRRRGTCSEDNRPHECEDDLLSVGSPMTPN